MFYVHVYVRLVILLARVKQNKINGSKTCESLQNFLENFLGIYLARSTHLQNCKGDP